VEYGGKVYRVKGHGTWVGIWKGKAGRKDGAWEWGSGGWVRGRGRGEYGKSRIIPCLHDTTGCQTGCQTVLNGQPLFVQPVVKPGCTTGLTTGSILDTAGLSNRLSNGFDNRFDNRLYRAYGA